MTPDDVVSRWERVALKPVTAFTPAEWRTLHGFFRDRELADWNDARPIRLPEWLFRRVMQDEEKSGERAGFGILNERGQLIGSAELYDLRPAPPARPTRATLGVMIGLKDLWGHGYGREAVHALLQWAFRVREEPLERVRLTTFGHNRRAQRAFLACGFREVGRYEQLHRTDVHMEILRAEWLNARPSAGPS
ncbi:MULTISPECIES: GNAT family N-acetyltransferase [Deinococcus]|jgi:RimJ/RimL family protein N-acetyltransferase|uniref:Kanamycin resistance protein n=2 Tax=Deinococcus TaxID=1298 RepID=A0A221SXQ7_9DEIO|nr:MULTISPECIES: GNAT family protein [Deinococcus]ASN81429.1 kanamycin resistance protein [Deinococcus ficus]MDP9764379.1 RimJ/RimL family protein N-acetyltransferase [Deinococcus enclensis]GHF82425.1 kanamycin resistance protein [Deinococcus ficus]